MIEHFKGSIEILKSDWENLLQLFQADSRVMQEVFLDLVAAYSGEERFYHTLEHIQHTLEAIAQIRRYDPPQASLAANFPAIQLAAWFHDVIYNPRADDNEEKSAEYAATALNQLKLPLPIIERVKILILTTKSHQALPNDRDSQILLDADLAILGADEMDYQAYAQAIRQEYTWVPDELYRVGRRQVLQNFLQRQRIYFTNYLFHKLEARARQNLQGELAALE